MMTRDICMTPETRNLYRAIVSVILDATSEDGETIVDDLGPDEALKEVLWQLGEKAKKEAFTFDADTARRVARTILEGL
jgi:hypothetical protein